MTIEIAGAQVRWIYRISPDDPCLVERRENKPYAKWTWYLHRDTPQEAKAALFALAQNEQGAKP